MPITNPIIQLRPSHVEYFAPTTDGESIRISCDCAIGENHEYADWLALTYDRHLPICELTVGPPKSSPHAGLE